MVLHAGATAPPTSALPITRASRRPDSGSSSTSARLNWVDTTTQDHAWTRTDRVIGVARFFSLMSLTSLDELQIVSAPDGPHAFAPPCAGTAEAASSQQYRKAARASAQTQLSTWTARCHWPANQRLAVAARCASTTATCSADADAQQQALRRIVASSALRV